MFWMNKFSFKQRQWVMRQRERERETSHGVAWHGNDVALRKKGCVFCNPFFFSLICIVSAFAFWTTSLHSTQPNPTRIEIAAVWRKLFPFELLLWQGITIRRSRRRLEMLATSISLSFALVCQRSHKFWRRRLSISISIPTDACRKERKAKESEGTS